MTILALCWRAVSSAWSFLKSWALPTKYFSADSLTSLIASASPCASRTLPCFTPSAFLISARRAPSATVSVAVAKSIAATFSFSAFTTLFIVSWTSWGG